MEALTALFLSGDTHTIDTWPYSVNQAVLQVVGRIGALDGLFGTVYLVNLNEKSCNAFQVAIIPGNHIMEHLVRLCHSLISTYLTLSSKCFGALGLAAGQKSD